MGQLDFNWRFIIKMLSQLGATGLNGWNYLHSFQYDPFSINFIYIHLLMYPHVFLVYTIIITKYSFQVSTDIFLFTFINFLLSLQEFFYVKISKMSLSSVSALDLSVH